MIINSKKLLLWVLVIIGLVVILWYLQLTSQNRSVFSNPYEPQPVQPTLYTNEFPRELMLFDSQGQNFTVTKEGNKTVVQTRFNTNNRVGLVFSGYRTSLLNNSWTLETDDTKNNLIVASKQAYRATLRLNKIPTGTEVNLKVTY